MLVTVACEPASCLTMLPQKFSAATTLMRVVGPAFGAVVGDAPATLGTERRARRPATTATRAGRRR